MKTKFLIITGIVFGTIIPSLVYGLEIPMTADDVIETFDLIILGTVTNVKSVDGNPPEFQIDIEQVVKPQSFEGKTITAIGCDPNKSYRGTSCPSFKVGQRGLFLLSISGNEYVVSSLSSVSEPRCTAEQYLARYRGLVYNFFWTQDGQNDVFFTKKPVMIHYLLMNHDMKEKDYSLHLNAHAGNSVFSDVINGTMSHCTAFTEVTTSFVPTVMGTYGFDVEHNDGEESFYGLAIIDHDSTPLKQRLAGIHGQDTWCRDDLFLILKNDNTGPRFDNHSACVTKNTVEKLIERNWGFVPQESKAYE